jgi:hypothetical protein
MGMGMGDMGRGGEPDEWGWKNEEADCRDEDGKHGDCSTGPLAETSNTKSEGHREGCETVAIG